MRAREFLKSITESDTELEPVRDRIISQIKVTQDRDVLNRVLAALSRGDVATRLAKAIRTDQAGELASNRDPDLRGHIDELARVIAEVPGPYDEKVAFLDGLDQGYVNIPKMLSGSRVTFRELLTPGDTDVPIYMIERIFSALERFGTGTTAKGPGEYALAVMSPEITISGAGDIKIGDQVVEVKASGGRIGTTGDLKMTQVPNILARHLTPDGLQQLMDNRPGLTLKKLAMSMDSVIQQYRTDKPADQVRSELVDELIDYVFSNKTLESIQNLKDALKDPSSSKMPLDKLYTIASWESYQGTDTKKFDGLMLINFSTRELQYFTNPEEMHAASTVPTINLISSNERNILPPVTLRAPTKRTAQLPKVKDDVSPEQLPTMFKDYAEKIITRSGEPTSNKLVADVAAAIQGLWGKVPNTRIPSELAKQFPFLEGPAPTLANVTPTAPVAATQPSQPPQT